MRTEEADRARRGDREVAIVPARDEAARVGAVIRDLKAIAPAVDVVVIDDGSSDGTAEVARRAGARVLRHPFNLGYGGALQTGYLYALRRGYAKVVQIDADGQHDPRLVPDLLAAVGAGRADLAIASRFAGGQRPPMHWLRRFGSAGLRLLGRALAGVRASDPTSGLRAMDRAVVERLARDFPADYPDLDVLIGLTLAGARIIEIPARVRPRQGGTSMHSGLRPIYYLYKVSLASVMAALRARRQE